MLKLSSFMVFQKAYAAVVYIRYKLKDGSYFVNVVASKTKVNPIERKKLNNSKIRIDGCVLLNQLLFSVYFSLKFNHEDVKLFCWTDSLDCLFWIHNTKKLWK